ncbi:MAG: RNA polymerase sigma factor [Candidatus Magasanikbacteria bacterium]
MSQLEEKKLLYKIRSEKDSEAFGKLYDHYIDDIYRFIYYKVGNEQDAQDLTNEVFLKTWKYVTDPDKKEVNNFRALIYKTARTKVIDFYRSNVDQEQHPIDDILSVKPSDEDVEQETKQKIEHEELLKTLKKLKDNYQEVIVLRYLQELSTKETAEVMDKSRSSVRVTLHRAVKKIRELLDEQESE